MLPYPLFYRTSFYPFMRPFQGPINPRSSLEPSIFRIVWRDVVWLFIPRGHFREVFSIKHIPVQLWFRTETLLFQFGRISDNAQVTTEQGTGGWYVSALLRCTTSTWTRWSSPLSFTLVEASSGQNDLLRYSNSVRELAANVCNTHHD